MIQARNAAAAIAALGLTVAAGPSIAAEAEPAFRLAQGSGYSEEQLRAYAVANLEVREIQQEFVNRAQGIESTEERQQLRREMTQEMVRAIEGVRGIDVEQYTEIAEAARRDPDLSARVERYADQADQ